MGRNIGQLEYMGVYVIFEGDKAIYVGSAGGGKHPLKYRIGDLFGYRSRSKSSLYYHPLTRKLAKKTGAKDPEQALDEVRNFYLESCSFKVVKTDTIDQARTLEHVFIICWIIQNTTRDETPQWRHLLQTPLF